MRRRGEHLREGGGETSLKGRGKRFEVLPREFGKRKGLFSSVLSKGGEGIKEKTGNSSVSSAESLENTTYYY